MSRLNGKRAEAEEQGLKVNVAILGAGGIAKSMANTLVEMAGDSRYSGLIEPYAVAARDADRASDFAQKYGFDVSYGSYDELLADPKVDLVYIATPHALHAEQGIACLKAGKNILVEKSFTANTSQAQELLDVAEKTGLLCTEAIWTRYMPSRGIVAELIKSGEIGEVQAATANLCYPTTHKARMTDPEMAGGALLDVGVYPLNFFDMALGADTNERKISDISTSMVPYETGVDATDSIALHYDDGVMATATASMLCASDRSGAIWGTKGYMVCRNINNIEGIDLYDLDHKLIRHVDIPTQLTGYEYEVAASANAILDGKTECSEMPHADTLRIMKLMDQIRGKWGLKYPFE
ncbi:Gfo/Idh/MocA family oxidoreductase [Bifidobacterium sp. ESL0690]|uniref:Gfo/Idh/MocA family protein n=1 Tax=Bifidobacterium sp. ESL0690 TaxID=2983214 RepID=UPI0023F6B5DF|nr:Gfo/Idh/MocA family oxidoreductase [Bifidobacterium sp. ESL0690]WEV46365.1 Gfo/Idh/MocA family oxidoreductase [Bifidobacterium sp. ESL0690]